MKVVAPITIATGSTLISTNVDTALDPAAYAGGTTYALIDRCVVGEIVYESRQAGNMGHAPAASPDWWRAVGPINKMAMFDRRVGSLTVHPDKILVTIAPGAVIDTLSLRNLAAGWVSVTQTDPTDGVVYTETLDLTEPVGDAWEYAFDPIICSPDALFTGFLPYYSSTITVEIDNTGADAACGLFVTGLATEAGAARYDASDEIDDYSLVQPDAWGVRDIVERDYADDAEMLVEVQADRSPQFRRLLASRRAQPTLVILADHRPDAQYYGLISFRRVFPLPGWDVYALTIKGFT